MREFKEELERLNLLDKHKIYVNSQSELQQYGWSDLELRSYQVIGLNWLLSRYYRHHGCILGDEMGLGKTCQTIACILYLRKVESLQRPDIVICPRSVLENWRDEFKRFAPKLLVQIYTGDKIARQSLQENLTPRDSLSGYPFDVLITTYEICIKDCEFFSRIPWHLMIIDEAHRLKNQNALLRQTLTEWNTTQRILLTGTPVQNNLQELYSLLNFVAESIFLLSLKDKFIWKFSDTENKQATSDLHQLLQPFLLRRIKEQVLKDLPKKSEVILFHGLSTVQKKIYKAILTKDLSIFVLNPDLPGTSQRSLMNVLMELRKCVNHPYLFDGVEPEPFEVGEHLVESSQKLVLIDRLLNHLKATGHKVLMFSQMTRMLDILQDYLTYRGYTYERLDGSVRGDERYLAVKNFNHNEDTFVFLLSTKAGGQGLNLTSADTVIFVDSDFNPQNDLQAAARAHRIGQNRPVKIVRLIGSNTVEEIILRRAEVKLKLTERVVEEGQFAILPQKDSKLSLITDNKVKLQDIIKFGVDKLLQDSSGDAGANDVDLISLLGRSENGQWTETATNGPCNGRDQLIDLSSDEENDRAGPSHIYEFEGTDYANEPSKSDEKAFNELLLAEKNKAEEKLNNERTRRQAGPSSLFGALPDLQRKPRKQLTPEELEERRKKRQETMAQNAKLRAEKQAKRKAALWEKNNYVSCSISLDSDGSEDISDSDSQEDDNDDDFAVDIDYISGDVTQPVDSSNSQHCIIVHCADDSGYWGTGGVFSALTSKSNQPKEQYELAEEMEDLFLGDCHMIPMEDMHKGSGKSYWLGLIIAQHRDRKNNLSGIKLASLATGLDKVYQVAKKKKASVHLPRIGHDTPDFNWYGTERMLRKKLTSKGIPTFVYYYPRHRAQKRKISSDSDSNPIPSTSKADYNHLSWQPSIGSSISDSDSEDQLCHSYSSGTKDLEEEKTKSSKLLDIFEGTSIYCWNFTEEETKKFKRYIIAYDGDFDTEIHDATTHIIVKPDADLQDLHLLIQDVCCTAVIVTIDWLKKCLKTGYCYATEQFKVDITT